MTSLLSITSYGVLPMRIKSESRDTQLIAFPGLSSATAGEVDGLGACPPFLASLLVTAGGVWLSHVRVHICLPESCLVLSDGVALVPGAPKSCLGWVSPCTVGRRRWVGDKLHKVEITVEGNLNGFL